jgi:hypothetical protein
MWKKADKVGLSLSARELDFFPQTYEKSEHMDAGVDKLVRWIKEAAA